MDKGIQDLVTDVFAACADLTRITGRPVTPDGHLVGSIGEALAADRLNLTLQQPSNRGFDAIGPDGEKVEIKTTTRTSIAFSGTPSQASRLVVVHLREDGSGQIAYDGPFGPALEKANPPRPNGQRSISLSTLTRIGNARPQIDGDI